jgi:hypothetical protein
LEYNCVASVWWSALRGWKGINTEAAVRGEEEGGDDDEGVAEEEEEEEEDAEEAGLEGPTEDGSNASSCDENGDELGVEAATVIKSLRMRETGSDPGENGWY